MRVDIILAILDLFFAIDLMLGFFVDFFPEGEIKPERRLNKIAIEYMKK